MDDIFSAAAKLTAFALTCLIVMGTCTSYSWVQRPAKKCENLAKQDMDPGRARQKSQVRAGRNFSQPRKNFLADLCLHVSLTHEYMYMYTV